MLAILSSPSSTPSPLYLPSPIYSTTSVNPPPTVRRTETALQPALPPPHPSSPPAPAAPKSKVTQTRKYSGNSRPWPRQAVSIPHTKTRKPQRLSAASARFLLGKCLLVVQRCFKIWIEEARRMRRCETALRLGSGGCGFKVKRDLQIVFLGEEEASLIYLLGKDPCSYKVCVRFRVRVRIPSLPWSFAAQ